MHYVSYLWKAWFPFLLDKVRLTTLAVGSLGVVLTVALELAIWLIAPVRMTVTNASSADFDLFDWVEIPFFRGGIGQGGHQVRIKGVHLQKSNSDVSSLDKLLKFFRRSKTVHGWSIVDQWYNNFAIFSRNKVSVLLGADWRGIGQTNWSVNAKFFLARFFSLSKVLPRFPVFTVERFFKDPGLGAGGHCVLDRDISDMKRLLKVEGNIDFRVVLFQRVSAQGWRHPKVFSVIDNIVNWVSSWGVGILRPAVVTVVEVDVTKVIGSFVLTTCCRCSQNRWRFFWNLLSFPVTLKVRLTLCLDMTEIFALPLWQNFQFQFWKEGPFQKRAKSGSHGHQQKVKFECHRLDHKKVGRYLGESYDKIFAFKKKS